MSRRGLVDVFKATVTAEDVTRGKPDLEPYLLAAEILEVKPESCFVVENSPAGIESAKSAGATVIAVDFTHEAQYLQGADVIVSHLSLELVQSL